MERLQGLAQNLCENKYVESKSYEKSKWFKLEGWGYKDTEFIKHRDGVARLSGNKYGVAGEKLVHFIPWVETNLGLDTSVEPLRAKPTLQVAPPNLNQAFMDHVATIIKEVVVDDRLRAFHSRGQSLQEIYELRQGTQQRTVDAVVYPESHGEIEQLVKAANEHGVALIAYGGGTNVSQALMVDPSEKRMVVSVDMSKLNKLISVDRKSMTAVAQAGILGQDLEKELQKYGVIMGHEPDSVEFSTLGGWVSTRASGMKKNKYGNIDDIIINVKIVTSVGTFTKQQNVPRVSSGPDLNQLVLGSEGALGIITEVVFKVRPLPEAREYDSYVFPDFASGVNFMNQLVQNNTYPASCRLVDNQQFQLGMSLKTEQKDKLAILKDKIKKLYLLKWKGFDPEQMTLATILFEGTRREVAQESTVVQKVAAQNMGMRAGGENGERGYFLTFAIAYLRDFAMDYQLIGESFETSIPWNNVLGFCAAVKKTVLDECKRRNVPGIPLLSFRVTQLYQTGCAVYIYFAMMYKGIADPVGAYEAIEHLARAEILAHGGCISHHHGVGKIRKQFLGDSIGEVGKEILLRIKNSLDPNNVFATQNLVSVPQKQ